MRYEARRGDPTGRATVCSAVCSATQPRPHTPPRGSTALGGRPHAALLPARHPTLGPLSLPPAPSPRLRRSAGTRHRRARSWPATSLRALRGHARAPRQRERWEGELTPSAPSMTAADRLLPPPSALNLALYTSPSPFRFCQASASLTLGLTIDSDVHFILCTLYFRRLP